jgi:16S rRNA (guanine527-N7)-methyltransferase
LPPAFRAAVGAAIADLPLRLDDRAWAAFDAHVRLLLAWNEHVNLTAIRDPAAIAVDHVADSLSAVPLLVRAGPQRILDIGSGQGFPGIPLAIALGGSQALLVEPIGRKARFLEAAAGVVEAALGRGGRISVAQARAEDLGAMGADHRERWPVVTGRAVGSLVELAEIGLALVHVGGILVAWKRRPVDDEVSAARALIGQLGGRPPSIHDGGLRSRPDNVLVVIEKARPTPAAFPRPPAVRRRGAQRRGRGLR